MGFFLIIPFSCTIQVVFVVAPPGSALAGRDAHEIDAKIRMFRQFAPPGAHSVNLWVFPFQKSRGFAGFKASPFSFHYFLKLLLSFTAAVWRVCGFCGALVPRFPALGPLFRARTSNIPLRKATGGLEVGFFLHAPRLFLILAPSRQELGSERGAERLRAAATSARGEPAPSLRRGPRLQSPRERGAPRGAAATAAPG